MKLSRFVALAVIALLVVGAMGAMGTRTFAQTTQRSAPQATEAPDTQETVSGSDVDKVDEQVGDQSGPDTARGAAATEALSQEDKGPDQQAPLYTGSITVTQATTDGQSEGDESAALAGQAKITLEQAKTAALAANPGATVVKAGLDNENGALVYSVELSNGADVKVDAGNGAILHTESGADGKG